MLLSNSRSLLKGHRHLLAPSISRRTVSRFRDATSSHPLLDIHPEVQHALATNKPVVALETALVTHGVPFPTNLQLSLELEEIVRSTGAIPATIGLVSGRVKVGLTKQELERLARKEFNPSKISRRDIAAAIATNSDGGTTCSATLVFAALTGIKVFATGGLGGVHRGGEISMDVSADLHELTRCPVALVSSGVKSILDIGRTLEYLETLGVPVLPYGESKEFPAFFTRHSGFKVPWNVTNPRTAAGILHTQWQLKMENGLLIAVPIPEEHEADGESIQQCIEQAIRDSEENGMSKQGKEVTPWLLERINQLSKGASLLANIALIKNTALIGGQIAKEYCDIAESLEHFAPRGALPATQTASTSVQDKPSASGNDSHPPADVVIIGSAAVDITAQAQADTNPTLAVHSTAPGKVSLSLGGVARNVAEACTRVLAARNSELSALLIASVGEDSLGRLFVEETANLGMRTDGLNFTDKRTAVCNMVLDSHGHLIGGVADMAITEALTKETVVSEIGRHKPKIVAFDGNMTSEVVSEIVNYCRIHGISTFFEPTSVIKSTSILPAIASQTKKTQLMDAAPVTFFSPNLLELNQVYQVMRSEPYDLMSNQSWWHAIEKLSLGTEFRADLGHLAKREVSDKDTSKGTLGFLVDSGVVQMAVNLLPFFQHLFVKCGERGTLVAMRIFGKDAEESAWAQERSNPHNRCIVAHSKHGDIVVLKHLPAPSVEKIANVTGAGDSFVGAILASLAQNPKTLYDPETLNVSVNAAQVAAASSLQSHYAVSSLLSNPNIGFP